MALSASACSIDNASGKTATVYPLACSGRIDLLLNKCKGTIVSADGPYVFYADFQTQRVIMRTEVGTYAMHNCVVADAANFSCFEDSGESERMMQGSYRYLTGKADAFDMESHSDHVYVTYWEWLQQKYLH